MNRPQAVSPPATSAHSSTFVESHGTSYVPRPGLGWPGTFVSDLPTLLPPPSARTTTVNPAAGHSPTATATRSSRLGKGTTNVPPPPQRLPKQSKGKFFVAGVMLMIGAAAGWILGTTLLQSEIVGLVDGNVYSVAAPWTGRVQTMLVREGDEVQPGQILCILETTANQLQLERLNDELSLAQAEHNARAAELKLNTDLRADRLHQALADYHEVRGTFLAEQARLKDGEAQRQRIEPLVASGSASKGELSALLISTEGQRQKVDELAISVAQMQQRVELLTDSPADDDIILQPLAQKIATIQHEMQRLRRQIEQGQLRASVAGTISGRPPLPGQHLECGETVVQIQEADSQRIVLYVPQADLNVMHSGQSLSLQMESRNEPLTGEVQRLGNQMIAPPPHLQFLLPAHQTYLPVSVQPASIDSSANSLRLGSVVRLVHRPWDGWSTTWFSASPSPQSK